MRTFKRGLAAALLLLSPLVQAEGLEDQLNAFFAQKLAGFSDDVRVTVRTPPNLYPSCEAPSFSVTGSTRLWGNVNVLARCANEKRYLQVAVQATGNYVVAAVPIPRGSLLQPDSVTLKRGRLDQLPPRTMLDINPDSGGIWAPCLSYADGKFWLLYTDVKIVDSPWKNGRNFLVTAPSIEGPWSEPIPMGNGGFDQIGRAHV